jgi:hypothetical protein
MSLYFVVDLGRMNREREREFWSCGPGTGTCSDSIAWDKAMFCSQLCRLAPAPLHTLNRGYLGPGPTGFCTWPPIAARYCGGSRTPL